MTTKADLEKELKSLKQQLAEEKKRPTGHSISNCRIEMSAPDPTKVAIAEAVREGMKALQTLGGDSYGVYLAGND